MPFWGTKGNLAAHSRLSSRGFVFKVRPLIPREREAGMAAMSGRMHPRVPLDQCPA